MKFEKGNIIVSKDFEYVMYYLITHIQPRCKVHWIHQVDENGKDLGAFTFMDEDLIYKQFKLHKMCNNYKELQKELIQEIRQTLQGDLSDIGNTIGIVVAKYFNKDIGDKEDFIAGLNHGISITDGTHG